MSVPDGQHVALQQLVEDLRDPGGKMLLAEWLYGGW